MRSLLILTIFAASASASAQNFETRNDHIMSRSQIENFGKARGAAKDSPPRLLKPLAPDLIKDFEGWEPKVYNDPLGYCTIGYGHLLAMKPCQDVDLIASGKRMTPPMDFAGQLTSAEGNALLELDTVPARRAVQSMVSVNLTEWQFGALSSFIFNVGERKFRNSTMLRLINKNQHELAANEFQRWVLGDGKPLPGLVTRRLCEAALFRNELKPAADGGFRRSSCVARGAASAAGPLIDIYKGEP